MLPPLHAIAAIILATLMFYGFAATRIRIEIISLLTIGVIAIGLYFFPLEGMSPSQGLAFAFQGFGHYALVTICALMVIGRGLVVTGALDPAARALSVVWRMNKHAGMLTTLVLAFCISMIINDTPVLVLLLPIMVQLATRGAFPASKTLMPVNCAILIGGMATTIGTSTNLLVVSIAQDLGVQPMSVFHFAPIVIAAGLVALPYLWLVMPRLLPDNSVEAGHDPRRFLATIRIGKGAAAIGKPMDKLRAMLPPGVEIEASTVFPIEEGARVNISGARDDMQEAARALGGTAAPSWLVDRIRTAAKKTQSDIVVAEMALGMDSRLAGRTLQMAALEQVAVIAIHQAQQQYRLAPRPKNAEAPLATGDLLLVMGTEESLQNLARTEGLLMLEGGQELPRSGKALLALIIAAFSIGLASFGLLPIAISALGGAVLMFVSGCVKFERVGRALSAQVIVLVAASIVLGKFMLDSGGADVLGGLLSSGLVYLPPAGVLAVIMLFVTILTNFASNATAAAVGTPIAISLAQQLNMPMEPMVLAVLFGCNLCYATPFAYQTNMLIMAEGSYEFRHYFRAGAPLVLIMITTLSLLLVYSYDIGI